MPEPRTSKPEYGPYLLQALVELGGEASRDRLLEEIHELMEGRLHPGDHELLHGGEVPRWRNQAEHMLDGLVEEGYVTERNGWLKATDRARRYLSDQTESL